MTQLRIYIFLAQYIYWKGNKDEFDTEIKKEKSTVKILSTNRKIRKVM